MVASAASSVSSLSSLTSSDDFPSAKPLIKFLCSYGGRILPRFPDGRLRYVGGSTRVLAVPRFLPFSDLMEKMAVLCGSASAVSLRCQFPTEDLDALVSVTSDEDLANLIEEYDLADRDSTSPRKIRAFLFTLAPSGSPPTKGTSPSGRFVSPTCHRPRHHHHNYRPLHLHLHRPACCGSAYAYAYAHPPRPHLVHIGGYW